MVKGNSSFIGNSLRQLRLQFEDCVAVDSILFRIKLDKKRCTESSLLQCLAESYIPTVLYQYHDILLLRHQGVPRMYLTLKDKYLIPNMLQGIRNICCVEEIVEYKEYWSWCRCFYPRISHLLQLQVLMMQFLWAHQFLSRLLPLSGLILYCQKE